MTKSILCYGDSNTWGYVPTADHTILKSRYARHQRWPGILQSLLGHSFEVIEEGLNSRTTNLDYAVPPDRNGKTYLAPCLYSHAPLNLVILSLGGNDTKTYFNRTAQQVSEGLAELIDIIQASDYGPELQHAPKILITTPAIPLPFVENYKDEEGVAFLIGIVNKIKDLIPCYEQLAEQKQCYFLDLSREVMPSAIDGVHYDLEAHLKVAQLLAVKIFEIAGSI